MLGIQLNHKFLNPLKFKKELHEEKQAIQIPGDECKTMAQASGEQLES